MNLYISVLGGDLNAIENLIDSAIGEYLISPASSYDTQQDLIVVATRDDDIDILVNYIWKWLPYKYKKSHDVRFYRGVPPGQGMRLVDHILW